LLFRRQRREDRAIGEGKMDKFQVRLHFLEESHGGSRVRPSKVASRDISRVQARIESRKSGHQKKSSSIKKYKPDKSAAQRTQGRKFFEKRGIGARLPRLFCLAKSLSNFLT